MINTYYFPMRNEKFVTYFAVVLFCLVNNMSMLFYNFAYQRVPTFLTVSSFSRF